MAIFKDCLSKIPTEKNSNFCKVNERDPVGDPPPPAGGAIYIDIDIHPKKPNKKGLDKMVTLVLYLEMSQSNFFT